MLGICIMSGIAKKCEHNLSNQWTLARQLMRHYHQFTVSSKWLCTVSCSSSPSSIPGNSWIPNWYCKTRKFSWDKFSQISPSKSFRSFNFHYSLAVLFCIITKVKILEAFNFQRFASSPEIVKINRKWNFPVLLYSSL